MDDTKKKSAIELQFNDTLVARSENVCDNYTASLSSLQEEITTKFVGKKLQTETLGAVYSILDLEKRSSRVFDCGSFLEFKVTQDNAKLQHANFCKDRLCPMCNWRRSKKIFSQASAVMDYMGDYQFLFLTLTVKNCSAQDLPKTVQVLFDGWRYLYNKNKIFKSVIEGTFRSLEVTRNADDGSFHPHLHCILAVRPSYFKKGYLTQKKWSELWRNACDLDYNPIVDIRKFKDRGKGIASAVSEATKYAVKGSDFLNDWDLVESAEITRSLLDALSGRRLCSWTGVFARIRKKLQLDDVENGDLVHTDDDYIREDVAYMIVRYSWKSGIYNML